MKRRWAAGVLISLALIVSACGNNAASPDEPSNAASTSDAATTTNNGSTTDTAATTNDKPSSDAAAEAKSDPYGKYDEPVTLKIAKVLNTQDLKLPSGEDAQNNAFYRYVEQKLNVKVTHSWQVETQDAYDQKMGVTMASRDFPDAFIVNEQQMKQLAAAGQIEDLTDAYNNNANPLIKGYYDSYGERVLSRATFDGKLMGIPNTSIGQQYNIMWIRQDWLDQLGLKPPQTLDELIDVAKTFIAKDADGKGKHDTQGITGIPTLAGWNTANGFDPIMGALHAYKGQWFKDASGNIVYSSTLPEMKTALAKLHEMYAEGVIDKQFAIRKDSNELIVNNQVGIVFGPWWLPYFPLPDAVKNDPKAEWKPYLTPLDADGKFNTYDQDPTGQFIVVRKGYEHPEAVFRVLNVEYDGIRQLDPGAKDLYKDLPGFTMGHYWQLWPFTLQIGPETTVYDTHKEALTAVEKNDESALNDELKVWYDHYMANKANPKKDLAAWSDALARFDGADLMGSDKVTIARNVFFGKTKTMDRKWAILQKMEDETFLKIVMGQEPIDKFDSFVKQWNSLGGKDIIAEIGKETNK